MNRVNRHAQFHAWYIYKPGKAGTITDGCAACGVPCLDCGAKICTGGCCGTGVLCLSSGRGSGMESSGETRRGSAGAGFSVTVCTCMNTLECVCLYLHINAVFRNRYMYVHVYRYVQQRM
jgi:hypothetical protein